MQAGRQYQATVNQQVENDSIARDKAKKAGQLVEREVALERLKLQINCARSERRSKGYPENGGSRTSSGRYYYNGAY